MSNRFSNYLANKLLNLMFKQVAYTPPTLYVALSTAVPGDDGAGVAEPVGNGYARITTAVTDWNTSVVRSISNANALIFAASTGNWGTISYFAIYDQLTGGNCLGSGQISPAQAVISGNTMEIDVGGATITL